MWQVGRRKQGSGGEQQQVHEYYGGAGDSRQWEGSASNAVGQGKGSINKDLERK